MQRHFGPWATTAIQVNRNPQLGTFWKRRLVMLTQVGKTNVQLRRKQRWPLALTAGLLCTLPTLLYEPAAAQPNASQNASTDATVTEKPATTAEERDVQVERLKETLKRLEAQIQVLQKTRSAGEKQQPTPSTPNTGAAEPTKAVSPRSDDSTRPVERGRAADVAQVQHQGRDQLNPLSQIVRAGGGTTVDLINLANSYADALTNARKAEADLKVAEEANRRIRQTVPDVEMSRLRMAAESYRLKGDLLRKVIEAAIEGTKQELGTLSAQRESVEKLYTIGRTTVDKVLDVKSREAQARTTFKILELILQANGSEIDSPEPGQSKR